MASSYIIHPDVTLGPDHIIEDFVIIGVQPRRDATDRLTTEIGMNALIRSHTVIYAGNRIGASFQTGHSVLIRELNQIGDDVSIGSHSVIEHHVLIGNRVRIHSNVFIPEYSVLEDDTWVGPNAVFTNALYPRSPGVKASLKGPRLLTGAKIGANATLLPGIVIGRNALVGAGAVVVSDVPDGKVVVGNPARVVKDVSEISAYDIGENPVATARGTDRVRDGENPLATARGTDRVRDGENPLATARGTDRVRDGENPLATARGTDGRRMTD